MDGYKVLGKIGHGSHGLILKARQRSNGEIVALKKVFIKRLEEGIPIQTLREILSLQNLRHKHIINLRHMFPHGPGFVLVFDFMITDMAKLIKDANLPPMNTSTLKFYFQQILGALAYMHDDCGIMHRDMKPHNILIDRYGHAKLADFGLSRLFYHDGSRRYTGQMGTRWYRAPEILFGSESYNHKIDIWGAGCIFVEMIRRIPVFPGANDIEQIVCIFRILGSPTARNWPEWKTMPDYGKITFGHFRPQPFRRILFEGLPSSTANIYNDNKKQLMNFLSTFLLYDVEKRTEASYALRHEFLTMEPTPFLDYKYRRPKMEISGKNAPHF